MKISTDNLQNRPLVDFRWGFWVEFCLIFCKMVVKIGRREYTQRWVDIALGMRKLVRTGMWWWELGGWERGRWSGAVLISTAAGMYDVRQLQPGSAAGSSPVWALLADRLLLRRCGTQSFWGESVCRWDVLTRDSGFSSAIQSFGGESVCRRGVGCGTRGV